MTGPSTTVSMPTPQTAERLFAALGASPSFVDDVLGDLHELRAQRQADGQPCGATWYSAEVLRALPHALRDGLRGVGVGHLIDWGQKALCAWMLLGAAQLFAGGLVYGTWVTMASRALPVLPTLATLMALIGAPLVIAAHWVLLGYVAAWMERKRPLLVTVVAALFDGLLFALLLHASGAASGTAAVVLSAIGIGLTFAGGLTRVLQHGAATATS